MAPIGLGVIGAGYWGPNLVRNCCRHPRAASCGGCATSTSSGRGPCSAATRTVKATDLL